jgi:formate dehydrogenase major subunit/formate dehydrogenase alpha subunit
VSAARLLREGGLHWPVPTPDHPGTPILHTRDFPRGRGRLHVTEHLPAAELPDGEYPHLLTTGRVLYHWHAGETTRRVEGLTALYPEPLVEICPADAARLGIAPRDRVRLISRRGEVLGVAAVTDRVGPGVVFAAFHYPGAGNANNATIAALDPIAKIPEFKVCAVRVERVDQRVGQ